MPTDLPGLMTRLEERYPDATAADAQPNWIDDLRGAHPTIETAFVRKRGPLPFPQVELEVYNQVADETGWHRIELADGHWGYAYSDPPAGVVAAQDVLTERVDTDAFEQWWRENVGFSGDE
ncbi:hypothetical protein CP556_24815 [Natrinema sp. CBA1119]|uniref:hypothetical protein n=1 Tax=Natrinema sp. CBA1119 TaxID=1608465 RepID=UPI000BF2A412|nr:hypothetical protein [Natrinema sp. CBA1119]PGF14232.1 hypothetical protein CP556_24815 [Natrinema sp. CBA1119]